MERLAVEVVFEVRASRRGGVMSRMSQRMTIRPKLAVANPISDTPERPYSCAHGRYDTRSTKLHSLAFRTDRWWA
jgi:hypothetical protein